MEGFQFISVVLLFLQFSQLVDSYGPWNGHNDIQDNFGVDYIGKQNGCSVGEEVIDRQSQLGDNIVIVMSHDVIPCDGEITAWEFWAGQSGNFRAFIARPDAGGIANKFDIIRFNDITVSSAMVGQKTTHPCQQNDRIVVQTGDMIGVGMFDATSNPFLQTSNRDGIFFDYITMDPSLLQTGGTLTTSNSFEGTISISAAISIVNQVTSQPNPIPTTDVDTLEILECAEDSMTAYVPRTVIGNAVDGSHLHFLDPSCTGTNHNSTHVQIATHFNNCGTTMEVQEDYVVFANLILDDALPVTPGNDITRDRTIEIPIQCKMEKDALASISFNPDTSKIIYREEGYGKFSFNLQLYEDGSYVTPHSPADYPIDVKLRDVLYFEADVEAEPGLELFVETCVATPADDPNSSPQYEFLQNGCPNDNTFQFFSAVDPMIDRFGLEAFAFVGLHGTVYVHCYLMICNITDPNSRCAQGCVAKNDIHKRSVAHSGSKSYLMSRGPIKLNGDNPEEQEVHQSDVGATAPNSSNNMSFLMASMGLMVLCVAVSGIAIARSRKERKIGYMIVPNADIEGKMQTSPSLPK